MNWSNNNRVLIFSCITMCISDLILLVWLLNDYWWGFHDHRRSHHMRCFHRTTIVDWVTLERTYICMYVSLTLLLAFEIYYNYFWHSKQYQIIIVHLSNRAENTSKCVRARAHYKICKTRKSTSTKQAHTDAVSTIYRQRILLKSTISSSESLVSLASSAMINLSIPWKLSIGGFNNCKG